MSTKKTIPILIILVVVMTQIIGRIASIIKYSDNNWVVSCFYDDINIKRDIIPMSFKTKEEALVWLREREQTSFSEVYCVMDSVVSK